MTQGAKAQAEYAGDPIKDALAEVGAAIFVAQIFEVLFVAIARGAFKNPDAASLAELGEVSPLAYKQPTSALLKELSKAGQVPEALAERIGQMLEDRHTLVHRMFLEQPWPASPDFWAKLNRLARNVFSESAALIADLYALFVTYCERFPDAEETLTKLKPMLEQYNQHVSQVKAKLTF